MSARLNNSLQNDFSVLQREKAQPSAQIFDESGRRGATSDINFSIIRCTQNDDFTRFADNFRNTTKCACFDKKNQNEVQSVFYFVLLTT